MADSFVQTITLPTCLSHTEFKSEHSLQGSVSVQYPDGDCQSPLITAVFNMHALRINVSLKTPFPHDTKQLSYDSNPWAVTSHI